MKLTGWQWAGLLVSIGWIVGASVYQRGEQRQSAEDFAGLSHAICLEQKARADDKDLTSCDQERNEAVARTLREAGWGVVAFVAVAPIPFGWLVFVILITVARAQVIGFRAVVPWAKLSRLRKVGVVGCVLFGTAALLLVGVAIMSLYVEAKVPLMLGSKGYFESRDARVSVRGTWTGDGMKYGALIDSPIQSSDLTCYRELGRCFEARAVAKIFLHSDLVVYDIESWSATTIVFTTGRGCHLEVFTIDRKTESVNGIVRPDPNDSSCNRGASHISSDTTYHLTDGYPIYHVERMKARPYPLRLIASVFGH